MKMLAYSPTDITSRQKKNTNDFEIKDQEQQSAYNHFFFNVWDINVLNKEYQPSFCAVSAFSTLPPM
jgi:hypothetical protein